MAKKELKSAKKPVVVEEPEEAEEGTEAEEGEEEAEEAPAAPARPASAQERRARMRERRAASVPEDHSEPAPAPARGRAHHDHDHDERDEDEVDTSNDPSWWVPHAVLGALVLIGIFGFFGAFNKLAEKLGYKGVSGLAAATETVQTSKPAAEPKAPEPRPMPKPDAAPKEMFGAKHLLVMYKGSMRAPEGITRTKDEAKARAEEALKKAKAGTKFEELVKEYSDEPGAGQRGGDLGKFPKGRMVPAFQDGLEKTKVGGFSELVETPFGFHVILRTQ